MQLLQLLRCRHIPTLCDMRTLHKICPQLCHTVILHHTKLEGIRIKNHGSSNLLFILKLFIPFFNTGLFKMIVGVQLSSGNSIPNSGNNNHLAIPFEGGTHSFKRQGACVSRNWRYQSEPPLKPSPLTCYKQFGTNSIIVLMFVESQRVHI